MKQATYTDAQGRKWRVWLPDGVPDREAHMGLPIGPPDISELDLPEDISVRLHNELFDRELFTSRDVRARRQDLVSAVISAFKFSAERIQEIYVREEKEEVKEKRPTNNGTKVSGSVGRRRKVNAS